VLRPSRLPVLLAVVATLVFGALAHWQNQIAYEQRTRSDVLKELSVVRAKLEGNINGNIQLVRGLVATIATEPDMDQERFAQLAGKLFEERSQIRNIAGAPDLVVSLMYPLEGNERAIGLDYRQNEAQRDAAMRARDTGQLVLAGPVQLLQGGEGFIARFPVFVGEGSNSTFWGIVSSVVETRRLYRESGLFDPSLGIEIAIQGRDGVSDTGKPFYGDEKVQLSRPVTADIILPAGRWEIAAIPKGGWQSIAPNAWLIWLGFFIIGGVVAVPAYYAGRMGEERQRHLGDLRNREGELLRLSRRLGLALETSQVGVFEYDIDTGDLVWDDRINAIFGLPRDNGKRGYPDWRNAIHPDDLNRAEVEFRLAIETTGNYHSDYRIVTPTGEVRNIRAIGTVYRDPGNNTKIVGVNWDVSADVALNEDLKRASRLSEARYAELEAAKAAIEHNALHDSLTGLPNRRYLDEVLKQKASDAEARGEALSLLHIDLDRFKQINDTLGHAAGDAMLVHVAEVLSSNTRAEDFAARVGGDEFVVVSSEGDDVALAAIANRIIERLREPVRFGDHWCRFGVSVGIASESGRRLDPNRLMVNADIALYRAKGRGRNRYEFFTSALQSEVTRAKRLADEIQQGLERNEFMPYFQPQFDAETLEVVGVEALARWRHPSGRILAPAEFLDIAEDLDVVPVIDRIVLESSLNYLATWQRNGITMPKIAVNVSARRLQDERLIESLADISFAPGQLAFELVESIFLDETDEVVRWNIDQIKELGIDIEIDDFGTGHASIVSLMRLKPKRLKIDRELVQPVVESAAQRQLVKSIVDIGRSLGIEVLGEGVETMAHAAILRKLGCATLQGYAFAQPMSGEALEVFLTEKAWMPSEGLRAHS
jgi:diguanylate cyclase (GGDEF)-like protein